MNNQEFSYVFWGTEKFAKDILEILIKIFQVFIQIT